MTERMWIIQLLERLEYAVITDGYDYLEFTGDFGKPVRMEFDDDGKVIAIYT